MASTYCIPAPVLGIGNDVVKTVDIPALMALRCWWGGRPSCSHHTRNCETATAVRC